MVKYQLKNKGFNMVPPLHEVKSPNIARFEAAFAQQVKQNKVDALKLRIGASVAAVGSAGFLATYIAISAGVIAAGIGLGLAIALSTVAIVVGIALAILVVGLAVSAYEKSHKPELSWMWNYNAGSFDAALRVGFDVQKLGRYGLVSEETFKELQDFERRFKAVPGALKGKTSPEHDATYDALNQEWREVIRLKIEADLPYPVKDRELYGQSHRLYEKLKNKKA
jgi:hypothetical protein